MRLILAGPVVAGAESMLVASAPLLGFLYWDKILASYRNQDAGCVHVAPDHNVLCPPSPLCWPQVEEIVFLLYIIHQHLCFHPPSSPALNSSLELDLALLPECHLLTSSSSEMLLFWPQVIFCLPVIHSCQLFTCVFEYLGILTYSWAKPKFLRLFEPWVQHLQLSCLLPHQHQLISCIIGTYGSSSLNFFEELPHYFP